MQCFYFIHVGTEMEKKWQIAVAFWKPIFKGLVIIKSNSHISLKIK